MFLTKRLSIQSKLILLLLVTSLASLLTMAFIGYTSARNALQERVFSQLTGYREGRADQLREFLKFMRGQALTLSEDRMVVEAVKEFNAAYGSLADRSLRPEQEEQLKDYYRKEYLPALAKKLDAELALEAYLPDTAVAHYLQYHYIAANLHPYGKRFELDAAEDGSPYSAVHRKYHPLLRNYIKTFGYQDLMLVDPETGNIVYSTEKTAEFATNLLTGPYSQSNLGGLVKDVGKSKDSSYVKFSKFELYRPNLFTPAAFMASPISDGSSIVGILVLQTPIDRINDVMTGNQGWEREGLGETGEVYVVGTDYTLRSESRFYLQNPEDYLKMLRQVGVPSQQVERIRRANSTILTQEIRTRAEEKGLVGQTNTEITNDYRGEPSLLAYAPFDFETYRWVIVANMDLKEAFAPIDALRRRMLTWVVGLVLAIMVLATLVSYQFTRPIHQLVEAATRVSAGETDLEVRVNSKDEFGELAQAFNAMTRSLKSNVETIAQKVREKEELLLQILPGSAAARMKEGEMQISETHDDVTVLFAEVAGFSELTGSLPQDGALGLLNDLIVAFDEAAERYGVEKVKTVGTSYLCVCGLSVLRADHAQRMVEFGLDLLRIVRRFNQERGTDLGVQIGINSGAVVGGVTGRTRFIYDLWGETVTVARAIKDDDSAHGIHVTEVVRDRLQDLHEFTPSSEIEVPGKGKVELWSVKAA
ncbi:MAG: HAMP domain-containing protein [Acidobacteria bacterium]|nr:HAMP domain-containing protein [Acidobacteriota bacterium]